MPTYNFRDVETGTEFSMQMKMAERELYLESNPGVVQIPTLPALHSGRGMGKAAKPDMGFRDLLKNMKDQNSKGLWVSSINDWS